MKLSLRIGIVSDSHDNLPNLRFALARLSEAGVAALIHCGDLISPFVTKELGAFPAPVHTVFGNNDGDRFLALKIAAQFAPNVVHHGEFGFVEIGGRRLGFSHYRECALGFAASAQCDAAFYGHTHVHASERAANGRLALNPGELLGLVGRPAYCVYDAESDSFERFEFDHQPWK